MYLHRCFTYALAQNKGNSLALTKAIESIPYHAFNDHSKCSTWCGYKTDPENYVHKVILGGFEDQILLNELKSIFDKLAANAQKFCNGVSSNANESLNAMMASKAPKSRCYSRTASADYRFACVVGQENVGERYTQKMALSPGKHHTRDVLSKDKALLKRRALIRTHAYKKRRMQLKKLRTMLGHKKKNQEGVTYKSNCSLLTESAVPENGAECEDANLEDDNCEILIIILDLETSGFEADCDILQIAAKCHANTFSTYMNLVQQISTKAIEAHRLKMGSMHRVLVYLTGNLLLY
ncbi:uncharacterized protein [Chelonus insularis]|uniref:uncharacterized protein n=1 Tax=Chelonus insularis TaxID=460826 RepID=UPI001588F8DC|nr:uncharacterized protein LOC118070745 [Chelonus insularis]